MNKFINNNKLIIDCKVNKNAIVGGIGMNESFIYIQEESQRIVKQYEDKLKDLSDEQKEAISCIVKDIFKLGANFGAEIVSKIK